MLLRSRRLIYAVPLVQAAASFSESGWTFPHLFDCTDTPSVLTTVLGEAVSYDELVLAAVRVGVPSQNRSRSTSH